MTREKNTTAQQRDLVQRIRTEGGQIAYETAIEICQDTKAPQNARATALTALLRAGGFFNSDPEHASGKEPHEMTAEELQAAVAGLELRGSYVRSLLDDNDIFR